ncbi:MAG: translation initiation factor IF-5A [Candidatus Aenigmarchaeota archaeon]|nr:translation initiation factor IF-5A [Candidatus Aenigmarchaeota archaeon]
MEKTTAVIKNLKKGQFVLIDSVPCRVESVQVSKAGKHGAAKARLDAIGIFDGRRRSIVKPADETVEVPIIQKKSAQVLAIIGDKAQLMDLTDFTTFEVDIPEDMKDKVKQGEEITYYEVMGYKTIQQIK